MQHPRSRALTGVHRDTIMRLGLRVGRGCASLHDRTFLGLRVNRIEMDELWSFVARKQRKVTQDNDTISGDQYVFTALASSSKAIIAYKIGKRNGATTEAFVYDLRDRVVGRPEISSDSWSPYQPSMRAAFGDRVHYGQINKQYAGEPSREASRRYSPGVVVAVARNVITGMPAHISTSYIERSNLSVRMACRRFTRLTNGFSKKLENHGAAFSLFVAHYNFCRVHETTKTTPAIALGLTDHVWSISELIDRALALSPSGGNTLPPLPKKPTLRVIRGDRS